MRLLRTLLDLHNIELQAQERGQRVGREALPRPQPRPLEAESSAIQLGGEGMGSAFGRPLRLRGVGTAAVVRHPVRRGSRRSGLRLAGRGELDKAAMGATRRGGSQAGRDGGMFYVAGFQ
ncbi:hypothetical protein CYMTET_6510 [Cymbomonas tetramitiformis]|uniref:Uncharacterized protein n=1 Tax=Cymbomonas tetramitiformis TaxID=36881 RepID=A0AAE0GXA6_9CHLO|nr:hypothetical protein CYMTET_6510 [Cymbomonas tetramitiformis]